MSQNEYSVGGNLSCCRPCYSYDGYSIYFGAGNRVICCNSQTLIEKCIYLFRYSIVRILCHPFLADTFIAITEKSIGVFRSTDSSILYEISLNELVQHSNNKSLTRQLMLHPSCLILDGCFGENINLHLIIASTYKESNNVFCITVNTSSRELLTNDNNLLYILMNNIYSRERGCNKYKRSSLISGSNKMFYWSNSGILFFCVEARIFSIRSSVLSNPTPTYTNSIINSDSNHFSQTSLDNLDCTVTVHSRYITCIDGLFSNSTTNIPQIIFSDCIGNIFIVSGSLPSGNIQQSQPLPINIHWHSSSVRSLCASLYGSFFSGGNEEVLVSWSANSTNYTPKFLPRLGGAIYQIIASPKITANNIKNRLQGGDCVLGLNQSEIMNKPQICIILNCNIILVIDITNFEIIAHKSTISDGTDLLSIPDEICGCSFVVNDNKEKAAIIPAKPGFIQLCKMDKLLNSSPFPSNGSIETINVIGKTSQGSTAFTLWLSRCEFNNNGNISSSAKNILDNDDQQGELINNENDSFEEKIITTQKSTPTTTIENAEEDISKKETKSKKENKKLDEKEKKTDNDKHIQTKKETDKENIGNTIATTESSEIKQLSPVSETKPISYEKANKIIEKKEKNLLLLEEEMKNCYKSHVRIEDMVNLYTVQKIATSIDGNIIATIHGVRSKVSSATTQNGQTKNEIESIDQSSSSSTSFINPKLKNKNLDSTQSQQVLNIYGKKTSGLSYIEDNTNGRYMYGFDNDYEKLATCQLPHIDGCVGMAFGSKYLVTCGRNDIRIFKCNQNEENGVVKHTINEFLSLELFSSLMLSHKAIHTSINSYGKLSGANALAKIYGNSTNIASPNAFKKVCYSYTIPKGIAEVREITSCGITHDDSLIIVLIEHRRLINTEQSLINQDKKEEDKNNIELFYTCKIFTPTIIEKGKPQFLAEIPLPGSVVLPTVFDELNNIYVTTISDPLYTYCIVCPTFVLCGNERRAWVCPYSLNCASFEIKPNQSAVENGIYCRIQLAAPKPNARGNAILFCTRYTEDPKNYILYGSSIIEVSETSVVDYGQLPLSCPKYVSSINANPNSNDLLVVGRNANGERIVSNITLPYISNTKDQHQYQQTNSVESSTKKKQKEITDEKWKGQNLSISASKNDNAKAIIAPLSTSGNTQHFNSLLNIPSHTLPAGETILTELLQSSLF